MMRRESEALHSLQQSDLLSEKIESLFSHCAGDQKCKERIRVLEKRRLFFFSK